MVPAVFLCVCVCVRNVEIPTLICVFPFRCSVSHWHLLSHQGPRLPRRGCYWGSLQVSLQTIPRRLRLISFKFFVLSLIPHLLHVLSPQRTAWGLGFKRRDILECSRSDQTSLLKPHGIDSSFSLPLSCPSLFLEMSWIQAFYTSGKNPFLAVFTRPSCCHIGEVILSENSLVWHHTQDVKDYR